MPMSGKYDRATDNFGPHMNEKSILKEQDIERDYKALTSKSSDTGSGTRDKLSEYMSQDKIFASELSSFLK